MRFFIDEDLSPAGDFLALVEEAGLHPGLIVMPLATRSEERAWMTAAILSIEGEAKTASQEPAALMINRLVEVDDAGECRHYDYP